MEKQFLVFVYLAGVPTSLKPIVRLNFSDDISVFQLMKGVNTLLTHICIKTEVLSTNLAGEDIRKQYVGELLPLTMLEYKEELRSFVGITSINPEGPKKIIVFIYEG